MAHTDESDVIRVTLEAIEYVALGIEVVAVGIILLGVVAATMRFFTDRQKKGSDVRQDAYRARLGNSLLVGLEVLVAADVVRTVALEPSLENVGILGGLVLIRTFLSWSLSVEVEGRWPWQKGEKPAETDSESPE